MKKAPRGRGLFVFASPWSSGYFVLTQPLTAFDHSY